MHKTAIGTAPIQGITIAVPRNITLGSIVSFNHIDYIAQDRTAKRFNGRFDVFFAKHGDAVKFGIRTNNVIIKTK